MSLLQDLEKISHRKDSFINSKLDSLEKGIGRAAKDMLNVIYENYTSQFELDANKNLIPNAKNFRLVKQLDKAIQDFTDIVLKNINTKLGQDLMRLTDFSEEYFKRFPELAEKSIKSAADSLGYIHEAIGINPEGEIIKNSYLDKLGNLDDVKLQLKQYVQASIANRKPYGEYLKGMREIVVGTDQREGILNKYYRQYAFDSFNQTDAAVNLHYANSLDMTWFIYAGTLIDTSREFCRKRAGKVFSVQETKTWKNDPTLVYSAKDSYNPLINRGGYNCRHRIRYITSSLACEMGKKQACND